MPLRPFLALLLFCGAPSALAVKTIPAELNRLYERRPDPSVSDEFNVPELNRKKWDFRTGPVSGNWLESNVSIRRSPHGDRYLNLRGGWDRTPDADGVITGTASSSGVYAKTPVGYGFYATRWRVRGMRHDKKSTWHPAIWCHRSIPTTTNPTRLARDHIELDLIEFNQSRTLNVQWHSQAVEWIWDPNSKTYTHTTVETSTWSSDFRQNVWRTHGLEYHPDYIQFWEYNENVRRWVKRGQKVTITAAKTDAKASNINQRAAHDKAYWILSNYDVFDGLNKQWLPFHGRPINKSDNFLLRESEFQIDFFRFYPLVNRQAE